MWICSRKFNPCFNIFQNSAAILVVLMAGLTTVIQGIKGDLEPSYVGLAISYALMVSLTFMSDLS